MQKTKSQHHFKNAVICFIIGAIAADALTGLVHLLAHLSKGNLGSSLSEIVVAPANFIKSCLGFTSPFYGPGVYFAWLYSVNAMVGAIASVVAYFLWKFMRAELYTPKSNEN